MSVFEVSSKIFLYVDWHTWRQTCFRPRRVTTPLCSVWNMNFHVSPARNVLNWCSRPYWWRGYCRSCGLVWTWLFKQIAALKIDTCFFPSSVLIRWFCSPPWIECKMVVLLKRFFDQRQFFVIEKLIGIKFVNPFDIFSACLLTL